MQDKIIEIEIERIKEFPNHPFKIIDDLNYQELMKSIKENGVLVPAIVRESKDGYEMISGHRRMNICKKLGIDKIPCIIRNLNKDQATILMVDSNLQREKILPSEKAYAYKMKNESLKKLKIDNKYKSIGDKFGDCETQVKRYIRLTYLIPELLRLVDDTVLKDKRANITMGIRPAVELSYLDINEQEMVLDEIVFNEMTPSFVQAKEIRELSKQNRFNLENLEKLFRQYKPNQANRISFNEERIRQYIPTNIKDYKLEEYVIEALKNYSKKIDDERNL